MSYDLSPRAWMLAMSYRGYYRRVVGFEGDADVVRVRWDSRFARRRLGRGRPV